MPVQVKVDEDLPTEVADLVNAAGDEAKTVYAQGFGGLSDGDLWPRIQQERRMLFTAAGVVLFRLPRESRAGYVRLTEFLLSQLNLDNVVGAIVVVSPDAIRILKA